MKTALEILADEKLARMEREAKEQQWGNLVSRCRASKWQGPFWYQFFMFLVIGAYLLHASQPGDYRSLVAVSGFFILWCVPAHFMSQRRRAKALLAIIEREAPQLYRRLQDEKIA